MTATGKIRVTIIAPGRKSEGGVRSVVERIYPRLQASDDVEVTWLASQRRGSAFIKFFFFLGALAKACYLLPLSDVVHLHGAVHISLLRKSAFIWLARAARCRIIYHFHAPQTVFEKFFAKRGLVRSYALATLRQCNSVVVLSDSWEKIVHKCLPESEIVVIYNPVMEGQRVAANQASLDVLYLAHLIRRKGFDDLIKAFATVVETLPNARLVFCGSGETEYARQLAEEVRISANVVFRGWIPETQIADELAAAAVFCLPSYDEGLPMGVLEAMSSGVAIVTTPVGGIPDVLTHEKNALLFQPGDIVALGEQLIRLLTDVSLRKNLATAAFNDSVRFYPSRVAESWVKLYRDVTGVNKVAMP